MKQMDKQGGLLSKWLSGAIRSKEEAQLDRQAKSDPFLQDAMDGLRSFPEEDHQARLDRLKKQLQKKEQRSAVIIPLYLRRIAAAIVLALGLTVIWQINRSDNTETLSMDQVSEAVDEESKQAANEEIPEAVVETETNPLEKEQAPKVTSRSIQNESPGQLPPAPPSPPSRAEQEPQEEIQARTANAGRGASQEAAKEKIAAVEEVATIEEEEVATKQDQVPSSYSVLEDENLGVSQPSQSAIQLDINQKGTVKDANGIPVPGAQIIGMNSSQQLFSDRNGQFILSNFAQDSQVMIRHFNYLDTTIPFNQSADLMANLVMDKKNTAIPNILFAQPYPEGGFDAFFQEESASLAEKKVAARKRSNRVQKADVAMQKTRYATIAFTISAAGDLSDFEVIESDNEQDSKAAIERLKNGPKWIIPGGLDSLRTQISIPLKR